MFYSETLLAKNGPLAHIWLSANMERKVKKTDILRANVKDSVEHIAQNAAPLALRLSGILLIGVVRIYNRKANYLLDDCNEALIKIKMAFRSSGNNDMTEGSHTTSRDANMLPDVLTEGDELAMPPMPDTTFLLSQIDLSSNSRKRRSKGLSVEEEYDSSQVLQDSIENEEILILEPMDEDDLGLDLGFGLDVGSKNDQSVEALRDAPAARPIEDEMPSELDVQVPVKETIHQEEDDISLNLGVGVDDSIRVLHDDGDLDVEMSDRPDFPLPPAPMLPRERISESPLSDIDETLVAEVEAEYEQNVIESTPYEQEEEVEESVFRNPPQRARRQRQLMPDPTTEISTTQIKEQQTNKDKILRPQSLLPRDPALLALMEMQKTGAFVSNVIGGNRSDGWAPELRGMLSLDAVRDLKRKRDSDVASVEGSDEQGPSTKPRLDLGEDEEQEEEEKRIEESLAAAPEGAAIDDSNITAVPAESIIEIPGHEEVVLNVDDDNELRGSLDTSSPDTHFDETAAPLIHPADSGPVSLGTKHSVHLLREHFGPEAASSAEERKKASVFFHELVPEPTSNREDATKMFFEVLVLATKDAIKVEQQESVLGGPIRIRGKRGLWGSWAEREAGVEIA